MSRAAIVFLAGSVLGCLAGWLPSVTIAAEPEAGSTAPAPAAATNPVAAPASVAQPAQVSVTLRANSLVPLRMLETLNSDTSTAGTHFKLEVTDDINVDDTVVIPAGSVAEGEIIHAAKSGMLGKGGELSVSARFVYVGERQIKLRAALGSSGANKTMLALFVPFARGRQLIIPEGTQLIAKVAADEMFPAMAAAH